MSCKSLTQHVKCRNYVRSLDTAETKAKTVLLSEQRREPGQTIQLNRIFERVPALPENYKAVSIIPDFIRDVNRGKSIDQLAVCVASAGDDPHVTAYGFFKVGSAFAAEELVGSSASAGAVFVTHDFSAVVSNVVVCGVVEVISPERWLRGRRESLRDLKETQSPFHRTEVC